MKIYLQWYKIYSHLKSWKNNALAKLHTFEARNKNEEETEGLLLLCMLVQYVLFAIVQVALYYLSHVAKNTLEVND